jgi:hypothetical protein
LKGSDLACTSGLAQVALVALSKRTQVRVPVLQFYSHVPRRNGRSQEGGIKDGEG